MKRFIVLAFMVMLVGVFTIAGCGKETETIVGPTEYDTIVGPTEYHIGAYAAITAVHETYGIMFGASEFLSFSSINSWCMLQGISPNDLIITPGVTQDAIDRWTIYGIVYFHSDNSLGWDEGYYVHGDVAEYLGGDPDAQSSWSLTDPPNWGTSLKRLDLQRVER